jgi:hypothetical protein
MSVPPQVVVSERFELLAKVGAGAFGEVWRAQDRATGQPVALKRLHQHVDDPATLVRFTREAEALSRVHNMHVVGYIAHGTELDGRPWLVTEWIDGVDLSKYRANPSISRRRLIQIIAEVAAGTHALHQAGLVHRDLKPSNVFVAEDGPSRVVDLGVAHLVDGTVLTDAGAILGTPAYMAPEQVRGDRIDSRADLWSLGILLYEIVTGETPFGTGHAIAVLGRVLLDPAAPLSALDPATPLALSQLVTALLDKDTQRRPSDAQWVAETLANLLTDTAHARWLDGPPRWHAALDATVAPSGATGPTALRAERRWVAFLAVRFAGATPTEWVGRCEDRGGRVETVGAAVFVGFGLTATRGDELAVAAAMALEARGFVARSALVAGWAEVRGNAVSAGALIDRAADVLAHTSATEVRVVAEGIERLEEQFEFRALSDGTSLLLAPRTGASIGLGLSPKLLGKPSKMVGRDKELALLLATISEAKQEQSLRVAVVTGEPGLGKTRLMHELRTRSRQQTDGELSWLLLRADAMMAETPYSLLVTAMRVAIGSEDLSDVQRWLSQSAGKNASEAQINTVHELLAGVGQGARHHNPAEYRERLLHTIDWWLASLLERRALVVAIEDLHWADRASVELIGRLLARREQSAFVLLAFARPEVFSRFTGLWRGTARTELKLSPLSERAGEMLVTGALELEASERKAIVRRAGGNPLFLQELVRARAAGISTLPAAVHAVLQARLDALGPEVRRIAQAASVFGANFWAEGVAALRGSRNVGAALAALERAELISSKPTSTLAHCTEYAFSHALARDAAYQMLVEGECVELHALAADWLRSVGERNGAVLARHFALAHRATEAAQQYRIAARRAFHESAFSEAAEHAVRSLDHEDAGDEAIDARLLAASAYQALGNIDKMLEFATRAESESAGDPARSIHARSLRADAQYALGYLREADQTLRSVLEESHASLWSARVFALVRLAEVDLSFGRANEADALVDEALGWLERGEGETYTRLRARRVRALALYAGGQAHLALDEAKSAVQDALTAGHRAGLVELSATYSWLLLRSGAISRAKAELARAEQECSQLGPLGVTPELGLIDAAIETEGDDRALAKQKCQRAIALAQESGVERIAYSARLRLWAFETMVDQPITELELLDSVLARAPSLGSIGAGIYAVNAVIALRKGAVLDAVARAEQALEALGPRGEVLEGDSFVRWVAARCLLAADRAREADTLLARARERLSRRASRFKDDTMRTAFVDAVRARRLLKQLWTERLRVDF